MPGRSRRQKLEGIQQRSGVEEGFGRFGANGKIVQKVDKVFMNPTDFSKLK